MEIQAHTRLTALISDRTALIASPSKLYQLGLALSYGDEAYWNDNKDDVADDLRQEYGDKALKILERRLASVPSSAIFKLADAALSQSRRGDQIIMQLIKQYKLPGFILDFMVYFAEAAQ